MSTRLRGVEDAMPEEAAAILAALAAYMEETLSSSSPPSANPWALAGRLEAQRLPFRRDQLSERWQRH